MKGSCLFLLLILLFSFFSNTPGYQPKLSDDEDGVDFEDPDPMEKLGISSDSQTTEPERPPPSTHPKQVSLNGDRDTTQIDQGTQENQMPPESPVKVLSEPQDVGPEGGDEDDEGGNVGILLVCLGGGEDEVVMAQMASLLKRQGHKVTALLYGPGPREEMFPDGMKIYELPVGEADPLHPEGVGVGVTPGEEEGVEWISGRVISSRVLACGHLSRANWVDDVVGRSRLLVTPLFLHDLCVLTLAQRAGVPSVGVLTSRVGAWWVWEQLGTLPLLSTTPVPPTVMEDNSIWSRTMNIAKHYGYLSSLRQQWQVPALTALNPSWSPAPLHALYANLARVLVAWDPLVHAHFPSTPLVVPVGGFSFETGHMTKDLLVPSLLNRAGVITVSAGGREAWLGPSALTTLHIALQPTSYTVLWRTTFPHLMPNVSQDGVTHNAKFVFKEEVPLNDILSHPRHRLMISTCGESEIMAAISFATPVLCLPVTTDQTLASKQLKILGVAEVIPAAEITAAKVRDAVTKMSSDRSYRERSRKIGEEFHDQPVSAADRLLFTLERVMRKPYSRRYEHKVSSNLYLLQQSNADVYLLLLVLLTTLMGILIALAIVIFPILMKKQKAKAD